MLTPGGGSQVQQSIQLESIRRDTFIYRRETKNQSVVDFFGWFFFLLATKKVTK